MKLEHISTARLKNGSSVALSIFEIISIPHCSIINGRSNEDVQDKYQLEINAMLVEVYQLFKEAYEKSAGGVDISLEFLWKTESVKNQPYNAQIRLYLIIRAMGRTDEAAVSVADSLSRLCMSIISLQKYDFKETDYSDFSLRMLGVNDEHVRAIVKQERVEYLQNQLLPYCYCYDRLPAAHDDFSRIISILTEYPDCAISFQLIPTYFRQNEMEELDRIRQALETLNKGVMEQGLGTVSFSSAEKPADQYRYYSSHKNTALFSYNILTYGNAKSVSSISTRLFGQLSVGVSESANLEIKEMAREMVNKDGNFFPLPWAVNEYLLNLNRSQHIWNSNQFSPSLYRLPYIITSEEASEFFRLPIGSDRISAGLVVNESGKRSKTYADGIINSGDIEIGKLKSSRDADSIGISLKDLTKHMLITGTPGSGKTTFSVSLLDRLWKQHKIPFLVIEPAKNEYRAMVQSIPDLQVFTPGKQHISPFVFNPFIPPKNVKLEAYKSTLKTAFSAAVSMSTPLDKIFEETVNNCYSNFNWLDTYTVDDAGEAFSISDFIKCFEETFDNIGYSGDAKNIGRAGVVRLKGLANLFDNYFSIPIEDMLKKPTVIELAAIENADEKALMIALLLLSVLAYVNANYVGEGALKNFILLEEAHVLLDSSDHSGAGEADPGAIAKGLVKRMLAEIRSYGVAIAIADQSPRKVSADVVALTDIKMVFRLVENEDKHIIGDSTNMDDTQIQRMSRLKPGEAFLFFNKLDEPEEVVTPDYRMENNISISLSDNGIRELSTYWNDKREKLRPYPQCNYCKHCQADCDYDKRILSRELARRICMKYMKGKDTAFSSVEYVFKNIYKLVAEEMGTRAVSPRLIGCVKVHIWRKIMYETNIRYTQKLIANTISK